jgi:hypothetical protein
MLRVDAVPHTAQMIEVKPFRNRTDELLVVLSMHKRGAVSLAATQGIADAVLPTQPEPAWRSVAGIYDLPSLRSKRM